MSAKASLVDAGPLIALFDASDKVHAHIVRFMNGFTGRMYSTWPVVTEVCHFLNVRQQRAFIAWLQRGGAQVADIEFSALDAFEVMLSKYADQPMDLADASLVWLGEKIGVRDIITLDQRDFSVYRTRANKAFCNLLSEY
jgi:hypothetical protein